jgi:CTP synthase
MAKYVIVVGGVYSGTGKGISAASIGLLLKMRGSSVTLIKCDPYYNINAGTMNPRQHGEVFLCDDGSETDLDLGHYERLTGIQVSSKNILTNGKMTQEILDEDKQGKYLGQTIQVVPHITDKFQKKLLEVGKDVDIVIAEIGGTVGDSESFSFYEAIRQFKQKNPDEVMICMVAPVIYNNTVKEFKTKPLQNAVRDLQQQGLVCELMLCRCDREIPVEIMDKISLMTGVPREAVFEAPDVESIYQVPIEFWQRHIDDLIADKFHLRRTGCRIHPYKQLVEAYNNGCELPHVNIGIVGKYENCDEAYLSLREACVHAGVANNVKVVVKWINAEELEDTIKTSVSPDMRSVWRHFADIHGVIVPGGFDTRGVLGKMVAIQYCREKKIPFLGICLGLQCSVIEFAKNVLGIENATSREFSHDDGTPYEYVVEMIDGQTGKIAKSGTMRLGAYECELEKGTLARELYKKKIISERHRHHYEINNDYTDRYKEKGFLVSGRNPQSGLVEVMELDRSIHPFFVATQAHPEFKSRLGEPAPLFDGLVKSATEKQIQDNTKSGLRL